MNTIEIPGAPPKTTAQMTRWRCAKVRGKMMPMPYKSKEQKAAIAHYMNAISQQTPIDGPVQVEISFVFPWRKSEPKSVTDKHLYKWKDTKPDCENLAKGLIDVMQERGCFHNDAQICSLVIQKAWSANPATIIEWGAMTI